MTSLELANSLEMRHYTIIRLIKKYFFELKELGQIKDIKEIPEKGTTGGRPTEFFVLNEKHVKLLITFLKNNEKTTKLKANLIKEMEDGE